MSNPTAAARPKRAAEEFQRNTVDVARSSSSKKPRFDHRNPSTLAADARDPEEELMLDADVIGKSGVQVKRNAVNIDGYDSDSDNDNFDARAAKRKPDEHVATGAQGHSVAEEEEDMFADLQDKEDGEDTSAAHGKAKKKDVRFLDQGEIEGQVMNSMSGGKVSSELLLGHKWKAKAPQLDSDDSEADDDDARRASLPQEMEDEDSIEIGAGGKKRHAPRLDAFNLKQEEEEGRYDEAGNYVRKAADPDSGKDSWLAGVTKKDTKLAFQAKERQEERRKKKQLEDDAILTRDLLSSLIKHLKNGETTMEALKRLHKSRVKKPKVPAWKLRKQQERLLKLKQKTGNMDANETPTDAEKPALDPAEVACAQALDAITDAAARLSSRGHGKVYDAERELLKRAYRQETGEEWQNPDQDQDGDDNGVSDEQQWEFRWIGARSDGQIHGPYSGSKMKAWNDAEYFLENVEFRVVGETEWSRILDLG